MVDGSEILIYHYFSRISLPSIFYKAYYKPKNLAFQRFLLSKKNRGNVVCIQIRAPENETLSQAGGFQPVATAWHWLYV